MDRLRLVFVARRFWPLVGGAERELANVALELTARGCRVTILTARWDSSWPAEIDYCGVRVVRLPHPPRHGWRTFRYMRQLVRWLARHQDRLDLVYVSTLQYDAYAALRAMGDRVPVVLRAETAGRFGDCLWQLDATCGRRIKRQCMKAAALVGPSRAVERELKAAGYPRPRIHYLPHGVPIPPPRSTPAKATARAVLKQANSALALPGWAPLAVCTTRLRPGKVLKSLVAAWEPIVARWPNARLWLAGERADPAAVDQQIEALSLTGRVVPAGVFDDVDELLAAADLFVLPAPEAGTSPALLEAMAAGLPIVAGDSPDHRELIPDGRYGLLVPACDTGAFSAAMERLLGQADLASRLGAAARRRAAAEFSLARTVDQHVTLFERLVHPNPSMAGVAPASQDDP